MRLSPGSSVGPYRILASLGAGGMGEVYRAEHVRLGREVALKVLHELTSGNPEYKSRFEREARVLASLNHPNIATLHGLEEVGDSTLLEMELVEGETLAERLSRGPMPPSETLPVFKQIAQALEAAHERGIIHRDLKPSNIKVTPEGRVKVLDFGLAKSFEPENKESSGNAAMFTTTTQPGVILGNRRLHEPRAHPRQVARPAHRHLGVRVHVLRGDQRQAAVRLRDRLRHPRGGAQGGARLARAVARADRGAAAHQTLPEEGSGGAVARHRRRGSRD